MILQNPMQVATSTIQNTYGAVLSTSNKAASVKPTNAVSEYAVQPTESSPILSAFFQTLSQIDQKNQATSASSSSSELAGQALTANSGALTQASTGTSDALQEFTYALFQNLQASSTTGSKNQNTGLGPLPSVTPGSNATYVNNLPTLLNSLSTTISSAEGPKAQPATLEGLRASYQNLINSMGSANSGNVDTSNSSSLASFLLQMSQNLQSQNVVSLNTKGSLLDTKA
jgi:hypothetical protein